MTTGDRLDRLTRIYGNDTAKIRRRLESDARMALMRYAPAPARPLALGKPTREMIAEHIDGLISAGVIDNRGRRTAKDEHGRTIYRDEFTSRWYRLDGNRRVYLDDDD